MELWATRTPEVHTVERRAEQAEGAGWDGITFTDSQNLVGDPFVAVALASRATEHLQFATGVTNVFTRHPAALANAAVTVQEESGGRFVLGIGRGDTALFHLGRKPMRVSTFSDLVMDVQTYLQGGVVDCDGFESTLRWLPRTRHPKVPIDIAASGPRVINLAACVAERITFAVGADVDRLGWAVDLARASAKDAGRDPDEISLGAYINVGCHPDAATARALIAGGVAAFAHFSAMPGSTGAGLAEGDRAVVAEVGRRYDSNQHLNNRADHTDVLEADFVERFAVVGTPERCIERIAELAALGLERFIITGPTFGSDPDDMRMAERLVTGEVLPALRVQAETSPVSRQSRAAAPQQATVPDGAPPVGGRSEARSDT